MSDYLLDSNTVIYYLDEKQLLPQTATVLIDSLVDTGECKLSVVSKIEVIGKRAVSPTEEELFRSFCNDSEIIELDAAVVEQSIRLRQQYKIKLADAVIAATALVKGLKLVTRNTKDFMQLTGLTVIDPWDLPTAQ